MARVSPEKKEGDEEEEDKKEEEDKIKNLYKATNYHKFP